MNKFKPCATCKWQWKIALPIWKRARRRYERQLSKFNSGLAWIIKPKTLKAKIDICCVCNGSGLELSNNFPKEDTDNYPHVAIVGGGIGGIALSIACLHRWIPFTLYERDATFDARSQGYGLTLQQASKAIAWLGIFNLKGGLISIMHIVHNTSGKIIGQWGRRNLSERELQKRTKPRNIHISRQWLRKQLLEQLHDRGVKWWYQLKNISSQPKSKLELEFQVCDDTKIEYADLIVGADGIRSSVRSISLRDDISPLRYLWCIVILGICPLERLENLESSLLDSQSVFQTVNGYERIYMMPYDRETIMWQLSFPMNQEDAEVLSKKGSQALQKESIKRLWDWHSPIPEIVMATDTSLISGYPVYDREVLQWESFKNIWNITLLWDAMHPMSPFKWQGANQAILDALDLARDITTKCTPGSGWRDKWLRKVVLKDFEKSMLERSALKVWDSRIAAKLLHSDAVLHDGDIPRGRQI